MAAPFCTFVSSGTCGTDLESLMTIASLCVQSAPYYLLPPAQAHRDRLCVHPSGLQVVQLGDSSFY